VEPKCSLRELASLCPQNRTLHRSDGNEEVSITPPSNCALQLQASFRQSMVEAAARHTPSPGMALCGYSVGITQIIWARTAAGCSSRSTPASIRKVALFLLIHTAFISPETMRWEFHAAIFVDEVPCKVPCKIPLLTGNSETGAISTSQPVRRLETSP
jgi:hypothetical protein